MRRTVLYLFMHVRGGSIFAAASGWPAADRVPARAVGAYGARSSTLGGPWSLPQPRLNFMAPCQKLQLGAGWPAEPGRRGHYRSGGVRTGPSGDRLEQGSGMGLPLGPSPHALGVRERSTLNSMRPIYSNFRVTQISKDLGAGRSCEAVCPLLV